MEDKYSDIDLARYFSGEASTEEKDRIVVWSKSSPENMELFRAAQFVWEKSKLSERELYDTEKALSKVHNKLDIKNKWSAKSFSIYVKIAAIAAAILLPVLIIFLRNGNESQREVTYAVTSSGSDIKYLKLKDGSEVWLNKDSRIFLPTEIKADEYKVKLEGEAYFKVAHNPQRVFIVETNTTSVKVLGTAFNLKARLNDVKNILSVTEGKVLCAKISSKVEKIVEKGTEAEVSATKESIELQKITDNNFLSWKTKVLKFSETPFIEVANTLRDYYQTRFEIVDSSLLNLPISTTIVNAPLEDVIKILHLASDEIVISKTSNGYMVSRKK